MVLFLVAGRVRAPNLFQGKVIQVRINPFQHSLVPGFCSSDGDPSRLPSPVCC